MQIRLVRAYALLLAIALAPAAIAQGTSGTLPGPIGTPELHRYALRLGLGPHQRLAAESFHSDYKREFDLLRRGEIAEFLVEVRNIQSAGRFPARDEVQRVFGRLDQLNRRIRVLDDRLFDRVQALLAEEQLAAMPRVRKARARAGGSRACRSRPRAAQSLVDLSELVIDLGLDREAAAPVEPTLLVYEDRMTIRLGKLYDATASTMVRVVEALEERGVTDASLQDPEAMMELARAAQEVLQEVATEPLKLVADVHDLNRHTAPRLVTALPPDPARRLRRAWLDRTYRQVGPSLRWPSEQYRGAQDADALNETTRAPVLALLERTDREMDGIAKQATAEMDALLETQSMMGMDAEYWKDHQNTVARIKNRCAEFANRVRRELEAIVGPASVARLAGRGAAPDATAAVTAVASKQAVVTRTTNGADQFLPGPIEAARVRKWAKRLELDEDRRTILSALHEEYMARFAALDPQRLAPLRDTRAALWHASDDDDLETVRARASRLHELRREAMNAIQSADDAFFAEVTAVLLDEREPAALESARRSRHREACGLGQQGGLVPGSSAVDLVSVIDARRLDAQSRSRIEDRVLRVEREAEPLYDQRWRRALDVQRPAHDQWNIEARRLRLEEDTDYVTWGRRYREILGDSRRRLIESERAIADLQAQALADVAERLGAENGEAVCAAFYKRAVPEVFADATAIDRQVSEARKLPGLTPGQRDRLESLAAEYRPEYRRISEHMVRIAMSAPAPWFSDNDPKAWSEYQARQDELDRLRFERSETSGRAIIGLKRVLSGEQVRRIGGLPELD